MLVVLVVGARARPEVRELGAREDDDGEEGEEDAEDAAAAHLCVCLFGSLLGVVWIEPKPIE
jgi:hypothetical protein